MAFSPFKSEPQNYADRILQLTFVRDRLQSDPEYRDLLIERMRRPGTPLHERLRLTADDFKWVDRPIDHEPGALSRVVAAQLHSLPKKVALKIQVSTPLVMIERGYDVQTILGELGLAPKLIGFLAQPELSTLVQKNITLRKLRSPVTGTPIQNAQHAVVMELVENAINIRPSYFRIGQIEPWMDIEKITRQLILFDEILTSLDIWIDFNPQFLVDRENRIFLIDFDWDHKTIPDHVPKSRLRETFIPW